MGGYGRDGAVPGCDGLRTGPRYAFVGNDMTDDDKMLDELDALEQWRKIRCHCPDMPGTCPGPSNCPMMEEDEEED